MYPPEGSQNKISSLVRQRVDFGPRGFDNGVILKKLRLRPTDGVNVRAAEGSDWLDARVVE